MAVYLSDIFVCFVLMTSFLLLDLGGRQCNGAELSVTAETAVQIQPDSVIESINPFAILLCNIQPANASVRSRWITPGGHIIEYSNERYNIIVGETNKGLGTILVVQNLSYKDAGLYTCEIVQKRVSVTSCDCEGFPISSSIQLILQVTVKSAENSVTVHEGNTATLSCEMMGYIPADEDLQWFKDQKVIVDGAKERFSISYKNGTPETAQTGGLSTVASRVSVLEVSSASTSDAGLYTCRIKRTNVTAAVRVVVLEDNVTTHEPGELLGEDQPNNLNHDGGDSTSMLTETTHSIHFDTGSKTVTIPMNECESEKSRLVAITFGTTFIVTVLVCAMLTVTIVCLWLKLCGHRGRPPSTAKTTPPDCVNDNGLEGNCPSAVNAQAVIAGVNSDDSIDCKNIGD